MSKRQKTVFRNNQEVCHIWASQSQETGRAGNISFDGNTIYSYGHWPMARFVSPGVVLFRDATYSCSTSGHQSCVRSAITHCKVFEVPSLRPDHQKNIDNYVLNARCAADRFWQAKSYYHGGKESYNRIVAKAEDYAEHFGCADLVPALWGLELSGHKAEQRIKEQKHYDATQADREAETERRREAARQKAQPQLDAIRADNDLRIADYEQNWITGKINRGSWYNYDRPETKVMVDGFTFYAQLGYGRLQFSKTRLRYREDRQEVETSDSAFVPVREAELLWRAIKSGRPVHGVKIGSYTVVSYNGGGLKIGCHMIDKEEIERFVKVMNW